LLLIIGEWYLIIEFCIWRRLLRTDDWMYRLVLSNILFAAKKKMKVRMGLALMVMLAMALGRVKEKQKDNLRSLVQAA